MVVGSVILNSGQLLQRQSSPVLIDVENGKLKLLACLYGYGEIYLSVSLITVIEERLLVLALEVLADLRGNGNEPCLLTKL